MKRAVASLVLKGSMVLFLGISIPPSLAAQNTTPQENPPSPNSAKNAPGPSAVKGKHGRKGCLAQAGIPQGAIDKRRSIQQNTRAQVQSICADSSLSAQQKNQKIRDARKSAEEQIAALFSPQQMEALQQCQNARKGGGHAGGHHGGGPCGSGH